MSNPTWEAIPIDLREQIDNVIRVWQDAPPDASFGGYMERALGKLCAARDRVALAPTDGENGSERP